MSSGTRNDPSCTIIIRGEAVQKPELGGGLWDKESIIYLAVFSGVDYLPKPNSHGPSRLMELVNSFSTSDATQRQLILISMESKEWPKKYGGGPCNGYSAMFMNACNHFNYAPVFTKVGDTYAIAPLTPLPDGMSWTSALGWIQFNEYNDGRVHGQLSHARLLKKAERHERLHMLGKEGAISQNQFTSYVNDLTFSASRASYLTQQGSAWIGPAAVKKNESVTSRICDKSEE